MKTMTLTEIRKIIKEELHEAFKGPLSQPQSPRGPGEPGRRMGKSPAVIHFLDPQKGWIVLDQFEPTVEALFDYVDTYDTTPDTDEVKFQNALDKGGDIWVYTVSDHATDLGTTEQPYPYVEIGFARNQAKADKAARRGPNA